MNTYILNWEGVEIEFRMDDRLKDGVIYWGSLVTETRSEKDLEWAIRAFSNSKLPHTTQISEVYYTCNQDTFSEFLDKVHFCSTVKGWRLK